MAAFALAGALLVSQAWAAEPLPPGGAQGSRTAPQPAPLAPGRSAGVRRAQRAQTSIVLAGLAGVMAAVVVAVTSGGGSGNGQASPQMQNNSITTSSATTS